MRLTQSHSSFLNAQITLLNVIGLLKIHFLGCSTKMGGPKLDLFKLIWDVREHVPCAYPFLNPKIISNPQFSPSSRDFTDKSTMYYNPISCCLVE